MGGVGLPPLRCIVFITILLNDLTYDDNSISNHVGAIITIRTRCGQKTDTLSKSDRGVADLERNLFGRIVVTDCLFPPF